MNETSCGFKNLNLLQKKNTHTQNKVKFFYTAKIILDNVIKSNYFQPTNLLRSLFISSTDIFVFSQYFIMTSKVSFITFLFSSVKNMAAIPNL